MAPEQIWIDRVPIVMSRCPTADLPVRTHATMTRHQLDGFNGTLFYWCEHCRSAHPASAQEIWLAETSEETSSPRRKGEI